MSFTTGFFSLLPYYVAGEVFSIERRQYITSEGEGSVEVCVVQDSGELQDPVALTLCTSRGDAISN